MTISQLYGLLAGGALMGNELAAPWTHRSLFVVDVDEHVAAEQAIHRVHGRVMPPYMILAIGGAVVLAIDANGAAATVLAGAATACLLAMLAVTLLGNVPINNETARQTRHIDRHYWLALRRRWNALHRVRVTLDVVAFVPAGSRIVADTEEGGSP